MAWTQALDRNSRFVLHPRCAETSLRFSPDFLVWVRQDGPDGTLGTEARLLLPPEAESHAGWTCLSILDYLLQYDFRGSNRFQEEENLEFLRLYLGRYPEIREFFREDILIPKVRDTDDE